MGCFGSFKFDDLACRDCKVVNSCKHKTYELLRHQQLKDFTRRMVCVGSFGRLRLWIIDFLSGTNDYFSTSRIWREIRKNHVVGFSRVKKLLFDLEKQRLVRVRRRGNGLLWSGV